MQKPKRTDPGYMKWWVANRTPEQRQARRDKSNAWNKAHRGQLTANVQAWREKNPDLVTRQRRRQTLRQYKLTIEQFDALVASQHGACVICDVVPPLLVPDHDHSTGDLRELLCPKCNAALGMMDDAPDRLRRAAEYLERHHAKNRRQAA